METNMNENNKPTQGEAYGGELSGGVYRRDNVSVVVHDDEKVNPNTAGEDTLRQKGWIINKVTEQIFPSQIPSIFQVGQFQSHSGASLPWKIECDSLTDGDWEGIASMIWTYSDQPFREVHGVPHGGLKLASALKEYETGRSDDPILIVDDVMTTGASMIEHATMLGVLGECIGWVAFKRGGKLDWVRGLMTLPYEDNDPITYGAFAATSN